MGDVSRLKMEFTPEGFSVWQPNHEREFYLGRYKVAPYLQVEYLSLDKQVVLQGDGHLIREVGTTLYNNSGQGGATIFLQRPKEYLFTVNEFKEHMKDNSINVSLDEFADWLELQIKQCEALSIETMQAFLSKLKP